MYLSIIHLQDNCSAAVTSFHIFSASFFPPWVVLAIKPRKGYKAYKKVQLEHHVFIALRNIIADFKKFQKNVKMYSAKFKAHRYDKLENLRKWNLKRVF